MRTDRRGVLGAFGALLVGFSLHAQAAARLDDVTVSDEKEGDAQSSFAADTRKIWVYGELADVPAGARVRSDWIAVKVKGAPPDYKIDSAELAVDGKVNQFNFSLSKPNAGWPVGEYRVDLFINGKLANKARFKVEE